MKTVYIILIFAAAFLALFEQSKEHPNQIIMVLAFVFFVVGLMRLMAKVPSKNVENEDKNDEEV
ncbi:hypothetical protein [Flavobacterium alkalisoli]|uniref:hypothetical protein n=1 Tax=Flavobacterium alkalisoli TaxID=2602769 RepID=UPI003A90090C